MSAQIFMIPNPTDRKVKEFLRELTELSRKHRLGLSGDTTMFEMEVEDMNTEYRCDENSIVSFDK